MKFLFFTILCANICWINTHEVSSREDSLLRLSAQYFSMLSQCPIGEGLQEEDPKKHITLLLMPNDNHTQAEVEKYLAILNLPYQLVHDPFWNK